MKLILNLTWSIIQPNNLSFPFGPNLLKEYIVAKSRDTPESYLHLEPLKSAESFHERKTSAHKSQSILALGFFTLTLACFCQWYCVKVNVLQQVCPTSSVLQYSVTTFLLWQLVLYVRYSIVQWSAIVSRWIKQWMPSRHQTVTRWSWIVHFAILTSLASMVHTSAMYNNRKYCFNLYYLVVSPLWEKTNTWQCMPDSCCLCFTGSLLRWECWDNIWIILCSHWDETEYCNIWMVTNSWLSRLSSILISPSTRLSHIPVCTGCLLHPSHKSFSHEFDIQWDLILQSPVLHSYRRSST